MPANGEANGIAEKKFNPHFTEQVIAAPGPNANPRVKQVTSSLIRHIHDFLRENEVTVEEWMATVDFVRLAVPPSLLSHTRSRSNQLINTWCLSDQPGG